MKSVVGSNDKIILIQLISIGESGNVKIPPPMAEVLTFWQNIQSDPKEYNISTGWMKREQERIKE